MRSVLNSKKNKLLIFLTGFLLFFLFRLFYGYMYPRGFATNYGINQNQLDLEAGVARSGKMNIASKKIVYQQDAGQSVSIDQKYEKIASMETVSHNMPKDEKKVRELIDNSGSIIQFEKTSGLERQKNRVINLEIGVPPEKFDLMVNELKKIGKTVTLNIDKRDKTNEYKDLQSKKTSLLKVLNSLTALKNKGGKIDEYINLENRILEIEGEIQKLGVSLGEFDSENEFCTVALVLREQKAVVSISFLYRVRIALQWSVKYYALFSFAFLFMMLGLAILDKLYKSYSHYFKSNKNK